MRISPKRPAEFLTPRLDQAPSYISRMALITLLLTAGRGCSWLASWGRVLHGGVAVGLGAVGGAAATGVVWCAM